MTLVVIGAVAGVLLWPLRRLATQISDRLVYGGRTSSYEAMTTFSHRVADTYASEEVLPRMASILMEATRAEGATVWLLIGREFRAAATTGRIDDPPPVAAEGDELPPMPADYAAPVKHQGQLLGALTVSTPANDPIDRARERLVDDLASQAGAVLRNVRLIEELRASASAWSRPKTRSGEDWNGTSTTAHSSSSLPGRQAAARREPGASRSGQGRRDACRATDRDCGST